ncbi:MAG: glycosyltransferase [Acidiferrobacteraceae bacterium]|nr:glycosyltransferase [Acidiferrobacteraceae bacterium]
MDLSIILPVYNEKYNLLPLYKELVATLNDLDCSYEIVFVDDGSNDGSDQILEEIRSNDLKVCVIELRRNFGQTAALAAGLHHSSGVVIITMDADGQNDPADIPMLLAQLERGFDMVCGWRHDRKDDYWLRQIPSRIANRLISWTTDVKLHDYGCTLRAIRREVADELHLYGEMHRFIPAIASWIGVHLSELKVNHRPRATGKSKYGLSRLFRVPLDLLTVKFLLSYSGRPIQLFGGIGFISGGFGLLILVWLAVDKLLFGHPLADRPILLLGILMVLAGVQFVTIGLLAEMLARTYHESQKKPIYAVRNILGRSSKNITES